jgi:hypothetical protein
VNEESDELERPAAGVDRLVREHLDRLALQTDAAALIDRLRSVESPAAPSSPVTVASRVKAEDDAAFERTDRSGKSWRAPRLAWAVPTLAVAVAAFFIGRWLSPSTADAAQVVHAARTALLRNGDRSYHGTFHPDPSYWDGKNLLRGPSETLLWTRGDRFWAETRWNDVRLVYGRDEAGTIWLSPSRSSGTQFSGGETPDEIELYCTINSMTASRLLDDVLADFELQICDVSGEAGGGESEPTTRTPARGRRGVIASLKPGRSHPFLSSALLEVDESDTLVRLILWTLDDGQPRGTMTYTLVETADLDDAVYRLSYHVDEDAEISKRPFDPAPAATDSPPPEE